MKKVCLPLLLLALTACTVLPNPDRMAWADEARPLFELASPDAGLQQSPAVAEAPTEPAPSTTSQQAPSPPASHRIWLHLGGRSFNSHFESVKNHGVIGVEYSYEPANWVVGFEVGLMGSRNEKIFAHTSTTELYAGVKKTFRRENTFQPHVGAGLAAINAGVDVLGWDADDTGFGACLHGGGTWMLGESFHMGVDLRALFGTDLTIGSLDTDADYVQLALVLGWLL